MKLVQKNVKAYTVRQLAKLAGVSVRTLHHYDHIGLLEPSTRTAAGYRLYKEKDLCGLQQILFFKELDFPLSEIQDILDDQVRSDQSVSEPSKNIARARRTNYTSFGHDRQNDFELMA